jgi:hypothetical protein
MRRFLPFLLALTLAGCATAPRNEVTARGQSPQNALPPMKTFGSVRTSPPVRSNADIARDFLDLSFALESGRELPVLSRFEGPITVRVTGAAPPSLNADLRRLLTRLRREAGITITKTEPADQTAAITIAVLPQAEMRRLVPQAACFVVPRITSWDEFKRKRRSAAADWTTLTTREQLTIFLPGDVSPQEIRDCLHEEMAQAIGPLNDLYRLPDSVFNDDNFHTVLTSFDMLVLRTYYAPTLTSGMTREAVAAQLPGLLAQLNPAGERTQQLPAPRGVCGLVTYDVEASTTSPAPRW